MQMQTTEAGGFQQKEIIMNANQTFALIDNASGFIWWTGVAASPEAACTAATLDTGSEVTEYENTYSLASNEGGYHVYAAPNGFEVNDGQDQDSINAVSSMQLIGTYREVAAN